MNFDTYPFPAAKHENVFLVGPMGAGKTTIGRQLAKRLAWEFVDSDHEIEHRTGVSIPLIFEIEGEAGFRKREQAVIDELTQRRGIVLATGGGAVLDPDNRRHLAARGMVVYLRASLDTLFERTARDKNRPLLQTDDPRSRLAAILEQRDPLYREMADVIIDTDKHGAREVVRDLVRRISPDHDYE
ncbi:MAG: shikimate kinase AroK [Gammaproteobacteria bacterium]|nr:shikimate kinase AroK [Gammaproteobacteria bacterium]